MAIRLFLSDDYKLEIPRELCEQLEIKPGQELFIFEREKQLRIVRKRIEELRGMCPGLDWKDDYRDRDDRF